jgi:tol-pal system protein YbgF
MAYRRSALLALSILSISGCADFGAPIGGSSGQLSPQERRLQDLENKTALMSRRLDNMNSAATDQEISRIRDELRELRGVLEKLRYDSDQRDRLSKDQYQDIDSRLQRLEGGAPVPAGATTTVPGATVPSVTPGTIATVPTPAVRPAVASPEEEAAYLATFDMLKNGKYDQAIQGFKSMQQQWPQGRYADNAWYWMGEAYYVKRDYTGALASFQSLVDRYPTSPKLADGLVKIGLCQIELKRTSEAKATLQRVTREFPNSNAANIARQRLESLGG